MSPKGGLSSQGPPHVPGPRSPRRAPKCPRRPQGKKPQPPHLWGPSAGNSGLPGARGMEADAPRWCSLSLPDSASKNLGLETHSVQGRGPSGGQAGGEEVPRLPSPWVQWAWEAAGGSGEPREGGGMEWERLSPGPRRMGTALSRSFPREEKGACPRPVTQTQCPSPSGQVQANVEPEENHQLLSLTPSRWTQRGHRR